MLRTRNDYRKISSDQGIDFSSSACLVLVIHIKRADSSIKINLSVFKENVGGVFLFTVHFFQLTPLPTIPSVSSLQSAVEF